MKLNEFKDLVKESNKVNIDNRLNKIDVSPYLKEETPPKRFLNLKVVYTFASILILFMVAFSINLVNTPVSTLTFDINPSIEVKVNTFNKVLSIEAINQDGVDFIEELDYKNKSINDLLVEIQIKGTELGYFDDTEGFMLVGVYSDNYQEEANIIDILADNTFFNFLTITQHYQSNQLRLSVNDNDSYFESIFRSSTENDSLEQAASPNIDYDSENLEEPTAPQINYSGYSEVKLLVVQSLINESDYTQTDLLTLLELPIEQLIIEYNNLD